MQQQGLLKYGWMDERVAGGGSGGGGAPAERDADEGGRDRWRRQWLVLRQDGLLLFYRRAKDTHPCKVGCPAARARARAA